MTAVPGKAALQRIALSTLLALCACQRPTTQAAAADTSTAPHEHGDQPHGATAQPQEARHAEAHNDDHEVLPNHVQLAPAVALKAKLRTEAVSLRALRGTIELAGEITADPDLRALVTARLSGRIVDVRFTDGAVVRTGQTLALIESPELARARATLTAARARADAQRRNVERLSVLGERGLSSGQELELAKSEAAVSQAEERAAKQTLAAFGDTSDGDGTDAARIAVLAPITGRVLARNAVRGESITAERVIADIADLSSAFFIARLFEKDLALVSEGSNAEVRLNAYPGEVFTGTVSSISRNVDSASRTVTARIRLANTRDRLKVGLFGNATISLGADGTARAARLTVPVSAVTSLSDKTIVFVREADDRFEVHEVRIGRSADGYYEVLSGLRADEQVVTDGVFTLKSLLLKERFGEDEH